MLKPLFMGIIAMLPIVVSAHFAPATLITAKGDTLQGYVDYRNWNNNPTSIRFRPQARSEAGQQRFMPADLKSFTVHGFDTYHSLYVDSIYAGDFMRSAGQVDRGERFGAHAFLRALVIGDKVSLYQLKKSEIENLFILPAGEQRPVRLLNTRRVLTAGDGSEVYRANEEYKAQLKPFAAGNAQLEQELAGLYLGNKSMTRFVKKINGHTQLTGADQEFSRRRYSHPFVGGGMLFSQVDASGHNEKMINTMSFDQVSQPQLLLGYNFLGRRGNNKISFKTYAGFNQYEATGTSPYSLGGNVYEETWRFSMFELSPSVAAFYNFTRSRTMRLELGAGFSSIFAINQTGSRSTTLKNPDGSPVDRTEDTPYIGPMSARLFLAANVQVMRQCSIMAQYAPYQYFSAEKVKRNAINIAVLFYLFTQ